MVPGLIDLDARPEPVRARAPGVRVRPALLVAAVLAALAALGGAAPPRPGPRPVLTLSQGLTAVTLGGRSAFAAGQAQVRAYDLPSGATRWSRGFTREVYELTYDAAADVLLVATAGGPTTVLDAASGRPLWAAADDGGWVQAVRGGTVLTRVDRIGGRSTLRVADLRTGRRIWQRDVDGIAFLSPEEEEPAGTAQPILVVTQAGSVVVLRSADGTVAGRGDLGAPARSADITAFGGRLYVSGTEGGRAALSAYSIEPFRRLWRADGGPAGRVTDCGPVLCVLGDGSLAAVDPAGGRPRWTRPGYATGSRYGSQRIFAGGPEEGPAAAGPAALLDAATGRPWLELGDSRRLGEVILRTDRAGRNWVSAPDAAGTIRTIGPIDASGSGRCQAAADYLACPLVDGRTRIWRLR